MATRFREEDWAATTLGSSEAWPQSLKTAVELMLANPMVSTLAVGPELTLLFNDAAAPLYGALAEQALGRPLLETFPEGGASVRPLYERALAGESVTVRAMPLDTRGEGAATELFDAYLTPVRDEAGAVSAVLMTGFEISQHIAAERRLRESEERQTYLLELSDALSPLSEPEAIQHEAMRLLGEKLGVSRAQYYIADETGEYLSSSGGYTAGVPAAIGSFRLIEFGQYAYDGFHAGQTQVVCDARSDPRISKEVLRSYETVGFLAYIGVPFVQRGRLLGTIAVHQTGPRQWTDSERLLVEETAERAGIAVEQARAEQALRESEERYRSIFASMKDGFYFCEAIFDADGRCVDLLYRDENDAAIRMTGQSFKGKRLSELGAYEPYWYEIFGDTAKTGTPHRDEMFAAPDQIWYEFHTFKPPAARENELAVVFHNINDRRKLSESEERYRTLFESMDEGYLLSEVLFDEKGKPIDIRFLDANPAAVRLAGRDFTGQRMREIDPDYEDYWYEIYGRVALTGEPVRAEHFAEPHGRWFDFHLSRVGSAESRRVASVFQDITDRRRAEAALRESEQKFRSLFESIDEGFLIHEMVRDETGRAIDFRLIEVNPAFTRQTGLGSETVGKLATEFLPNLERFWIDTYDRVERTGVSERVENYNEATARWYRVHIARVQGKAPRIAAVFDDITDRKRAETALCESEERQTALLEFSDALRAEPDANAIAEKAVSLLAKQLHLDRCYIVAKRPHEEHWDVEAEFRLSGLEAMPPILDQREFPEALRLITDQTLVIDYIAVQPGFTDAERAGLQALGFGGLLMAVLRKGDRRPAWSLVASFVQRHKWTSSEVALVEEMAERTWAAIERARAEAALRESEERFRTMADNAPVLIWETDQTGATSVNRHYAEFFGVGVDELLGMGWAEFLHPDDAQDYIDAYAEAFRQRTAYAYESRFRRADGQWRWLLNTGGPVAEDRFVGCSLDVTDLLDAQKSLRESEERKAFLLKLSDAVRPLAGAADIQGEATRLLREQLNAGWCYYVDWDLDKNTGVVLRDSAGEGLPSLAGAHDVSDAPDFLELLADGAVLTVRDYAGYDKLSSRIRQKFTQLGFRSMMVAPLVKEGRLIASLLVGDTEIRDWSAAESSLLVDVAERTWAAVERARVEVALRDNEDRLRVLVGELQHRVRNILTVIRSIFSRTVEGDSSVEEVAEHFRGRLDALARTQVIMTQRVSGAVDLEQLIRDELLSVGAGPKGEITIKGPEIELTSKQAESIGLAIHELTTNSIKYGALSVDGAKLRITWKTEIEDDREILRLKWTENGVPIPHDPERRRGFGRELIEEGLPYRLGGSTRLELKDRGVECEIVVPLSAGRAGQSERRD